MWFASFIGSICLYDFIHMKTINRVSETRSKVINSLIGRSKKPNFRFTGKWLRSSFFCGAHSSIFSFANFFRCQKIVIRVDKDSGWGFKCGLCSSHPSMQRSFVLALKAVNIKNINDRSSQIDLVWKTHFKFEINLLFSLNSGSKNIFEDFYNSKKKYSFSRNPDKNFKPPAK